MRAMRSLIAALALVLAVQPPAVGQRAGETWTAVIDRGVFSSDYYTWRLNSDGTYEEDGNDQRTGRQIQQMVTGAWSARGGRLELRQDFAGFRFEGVVKGQQYSGTFYQGDTPLAKFCAWKGTEIPAGCDEQLIG